MATYSSHLGYNRENGVCTFSRLFFIRSFSYLQVTRKCMTSQMSSKLGQLASPTAELAAIERLKKSQLIFNEKMLTPLFLGCL